MYLLLCSPHFVVVNYTYLIIRTSDAIVTQYCSAVTCNILLDTLYQSASEVTVGIGVRFLFSRALSCIHSTVVKKSSDIMSNTVEKGVLLVRFFFVSGI